MRTRHLIAVPLFGAVMSLLAACAGTGTTSDANSLTFVGYGSATQANQQRAWQKPFTQQTGVTFTNDGPTDEAKLKAMVEADKVTWDLVDDSAPVANQYCGKYVEKLDFSVVDKTAYPDGTVNDCGVPAYFYGLIFMYNTKTYGDHPPTSIADFFDKKKFPGKRIVPPEVNVGLLEDALLADGVPKDKLYPLDVDRSLKKIDPIKGDTTFAKTYGQIQQSMVDGQVDMALVSSARAGLALSEGAHFKPVWDKTIVNWDVLMVPKGAPNKKQAMKFIAFAAHDKQSAAFSELSSVQPVNPDIKPDYTKAQQETNTFAPTHKNSIVLGNVDWWGKNQDAVVKKYTAWLLG